MSQDHELGKAEKHVSYPADGLFSILERPQYTELLTHWENARDRVLTQPHGAITASRTMLEGAFKLILDQTGTPYKECDSALKLYGYVAKDLGITSKGTEVIGQSKFFGAVNRVLQSVSELRSLSSDAHFSVRTSGTFSHHHFEAQLAVNLAGSALMYFLSCFESYLVKTKRVTSDGRLVLSFDKTTVWRLVDHTKNAKDHMRYMDSYPKEPGLWLVADGGLYIISNGLPNICPDGIIGGENNHRLAAFADGCDYLNTDFQSVCELHELMDNGSDCCFYLPLEDIENKLSKSSNSIFLIFDSRDPKTYSHEFVSDCDIDTIMPT